MSATMPLRRVPVSWTTGIGGTGVSVFYSLEATDITPALGTFFTAIKGLFPTAVVWNIPPSGDIIEATDGKLTSSWTGGTQASVAGSGAGAYVAGTGSYVRWNTAVVRNGRKMKGRTFLVPMNASCFDAAGTITDSNVTQLQTAANTLYAAGLQIWGRPSGPGATDGVIAFVTGAVVPDRVTSLHSRRT